MESKKFITTYFKLEQIESLMLFVTGAIALAGAFYFLDDPGHRPFYRGMAWPLLLLAVLQIILGLSVYLRSRIDYKRAKEYAAQDLQKLKTEELPRMEKLIKGYAFFRWLEIGICLFGVLMIIAMNSTSDYYMGVGAALSVQAGVLLVADLYAEIRGARYILELKEVKS